MGIAGLKKSQPASGPQNFLRVGGEKKNPAKPLKLNVLTDQVLQGPNLAKLKIFQRRGADTFDLNCGNFLSTFQEP